MSAPKSTVAPANTRSALQLFPLRTLIGIVRELVGAARITADLTSFWRLARDMALYRVLKVADLRSKGQERSIHLSDGTTLVYRLDRGDIQSIREVWIDERYRLPFDRDIERLVDLGAHIGLASLWLAKRYRVGSVLAIEPDGANARLARRNLRENRVYGQVLDAAVDEVDGSGLFVANRESNLGALGRSGATEAGTAVPLVSMTSVLRRLEGRPVDLLKMDIEGREEVILGEQCSWLGRVRALIAEFHPSLVDYPALVWRLEQSGFTYVPAGSLNRGSADAFIRAE